MSNSQPHTPASSSRAPDARALLERQLVSLALVDERFGENLPTDFDWRVHLRGQLARAIVEACLAASVGILGDALTLCDIAGQVRGITIERLVVRMLVDRDGFNRRALEDYIADAHSSPTPEVACTTGDAARLLVELGE